MEDEKEEKGKHNDKREVVRKQNNEEDRREINQQ